MKGFLLILIFTYFVPLQCSKSNYFFVKRRDTKEAICIEPRTFIIHAFPTFDLDKLKIPPSGFKYWDWLADWQLQNDTNVRRGGNQVLIAGNQPFHLVAQDYGVAFVAILASNITLWMAHNDGTRGRGVLFELDHLNEKTKLKDTTLKYCDENPEVEGANCTIVDYKNGTNHLNDGRHWTQFFIKETPNGVEIIERSYRKDKPVIQWTWNITNISDPFGYGYFNIFAKSHQRNAAFYNRDDYPYLANNKVMKRNHTKRSSGEFCVEVEWIINKSNDSNELMEVKNLASRRVQQPPTKTTHLQYFTYFLWNHLDAGEYEFTLRFDERHPKRIALCQDDDSYFDWTWVSMPKAITKCQFYVGEPYEFSAGPSSPPDPTIEPNWTSEEWENVCDQLGIGSNDTEVPIKFCDWKGCNFSKCPHLHDDPAYIFDF